LSRNHSLKTVVLRLSNGYGAPAFPVTSAWQPAVNDICRQAVQQREIVLRRSGRQLRDFLAESDIVAAIELFLGLPAAQLGDGIFNIGADRLSSLLEMAEL